MKLLLLLLLLTLTGCDGTNTTDAKSSKSNYYEASAICLDGIQYWRGYNTIAVRIDPNTLLPKPCEK